MQIGILGPFQVRDDHGAAVDVPGARLRALVAVLALEAGRTVPKGVLVDWIWGEQPPADAANALQRLVSRLRKLLPAGSVEGHTDGYRLAVAPDDVDAVRFARLAGRTGDEGAERVQRLREALGLWRGTPMQDVGLVDSHAFDAAVTRLERLRQAAAEDRFDAEVAQGNGAAFVTELTGLVEADPLRERLVAALMRALVASGRDNEALVVYQRTADALADTLGADPSPDLAALHVALLRGELGRREEPRKTNLRAELTSYIGKAEDVAAVAALAAGHRLTTLTGPGGSGKTRLATETARTLLGDFPDGAWLVELAAIGADGDIAQAVVSALGLRDGFMGDSSSAEPVDRLIAAVRDREMLLVLDNCEHVIEAAAAFAHRLLGECRRLRILATSREPLGITGEALWPVAPLLLPGERATAAEIEASPAVRLLLERASAVRGDLAADAATLATVARVCRVLDGMPLAIELAATRLRTMTIEQLASRLDDRFRLLTGGSRTALPRHRTLRAMVDWSWELLSDAERTVLRRLSVFSGGAGLEAAERVCAGDAVDPLDVLELLTALVEKSLLVPVAGDSPRYRMLGTIKEYAAQRLDEAGETDATRIAHLDFFSELCLTAEPHLRRAEQVDWIAVLDADRDNITAAMRGALAAGDARGAVRLAAGAGWYWWLGGNKTEGMELITAAVNLPGETVEDHLATAYGIMSMFVTTGPGDEHQAMEWIRKAHALITGGGTFTHPGASLVHAMERMLHGPEAAITAFEPSLRDEDPWARAIARLQLGKIRVITGHGDQLTDEYLRGALAEFQALGERFGISFASAELAARLATRGDLAAACELIEHGVAAVTELGALDDVIRLRAQQAQLYWLLGDEEAGAKALATAERYAERVAWPGTLATLAEARADLARWRGDTAEAYRQLDAMNAVLGDEADQPNVRFTDHDRRGYLAEDVAESRGHRALVVEAAVESGYPYATATALLGVADLALRQGDAAQAARLLAASDAARGLPDLSNPDANRIKEEATRRLGEPGFAEAAREGAEAVWSDLVKVTLAS